MQLQAKELLARRFEALQQTRQALRETPGLALVWVGEDAQTAAFVRVKQKMAQQLNCNFFLHHLENATSRQLEAVIASLNNKKDVTGIVLQLPLPKEIPPNKIIAAIAPAKDIDNLQEHNQFVSPTPAGIVALLEENGVDLAHAETAILGAGRLVGAPLARIFTEHHWPFFQIEREAEKQAAQIARANVIISCSGVERLVTPAMVSQNTVLVDGSGVDVDVKALEPLVKIITPAKGAIGPLTVSFLFENLLKASTLV